jgi:hypothetical protein
MGGKSTYGAEHQSICETIYPHFRFLHDSRERGCVVADGPALLNLCQQQPIAIPSLARENGPRYSYRGVYGTSLVMPAWNTRRLSERSARSGSRTPRSTSSGSGPIACSNAPSGRARGSSAGTARPCPRQHGSIVARDRPSEWLLVGRTRSGSPNEPIVLTPHGVGEPDLADAGQIVVRLGPRVMIAAAQHHGSGHARPHTLEIGRRILGRCGRKEGGDEEDRWWDSAHGVLLPRSAVVWHRDRVRPVCGCKVKNTNGRLGCLARDRPPAA